VLPPWTPLRCSRGFGVVHIGAFTSTAIGQVTVSPMTAGLDTTQIQPLSSILFAAMACSQSLLPKVRTLRQPSNELDDQKRRAPLGISEANR